VSSTRNLLGTKVAVSFNPNMETAGVSSVKVGSYVNKVSGGLYVYICLVTINR